MRTKHVLLALAVPMAFAACTQEEFESNTGIQSDLGNRPVVGQISFYTGDGLATRLANPETGAIEFADGDQFGMVLMDEAADASGNANIGTNNYNLVNKAYTNYPFTKNGNVWTSEAELVEGNYFYYMPYTNNQTDESKTRVTRNGGLQWVISASQNAYTTAEPTKVAPYNAVKDNQLYIGYEMLNSKEPATKLEAKMLPVHGTIQFNLKNSEATAFSIKRIVLAGNLPLTGSLNAEDGAGNLAKDTYTDAEGKGNEAKNSANIADIFRLYNEALSTERADFTKNPLMMGESATPFLSQSNNNSIALNFPSNTVVAQGQTLTASMVVPACITSVPDLTATVYTDRGIMTLPITVGSYLTGVADGQNGSGTDDFAGEKGVVAYKAAGQTTPDATITLYARNEEEQTEYAVVSGNFTTIRPEEWNAVGINFGATAIQIPGKMDIYTTEDLNDFMNYCKLNPNVAEDETEIEAIIKAKGVELTAEAYKVLADNEKIKLTISGDEALVIPAGLSNDVLTRLTWATNAKAIVKGEQTIAAAGDGLANLTLTNEGTLTVNYVDNKNVAQITTLANLYNLKNATISTPLSVTALINGDIATDDEYDDILADAQLTVKANVKGESTNYAKITVEGNVEIGALTNKKVQDLQTSAQNIVYKTATVTVAENATLKTTGAWTNNGDITVNGVLTAAAEFTNNANIYNNYGIENVQGVKFSNEANGYIKVAATAKFTTISENKGEVEIMARSTEIEAGTTSGDGRVSYTAVASDMTSNTFTYSDSDNFTTLKIGASNVTIASTTAATDLTVEVTADGTYKFALKTSGDKDAVDSSLKALQVNENVYMTIASNVTVGTSVDIEEGATIQNNSGCTFTFSGQKSDFTNGGTFRNIGTLAGINLTTKPDSGNFTGSGKYPWS